MGGFVVGFCVGLFSYFMFSVFFVFSDLAYCSFWVSFGVLSSMAYPLFLGVSTVSIVFALLCFLDLGGRFVVLFVFVLCFLLFLFSF